MYVVGIIYEKQKQVFLPQGKKAQKSNMRIHYCFGIDLETKAEQKGDF